MKRIAAAIVTLVARVAAARPGGGQTFSSGGGRSSYSGGGGSWHGSSGGGFADGSAIIMLVLLVFVLGAGLVALLAWLVDRHETRTRHWASAAPRELRRGADLRGLFAADPGFSVPAFEDFAYALFSAAQRARRDLRPLLPYLSPQAMVQLDGRSGDVEQVVVGAMAIEGFAETSAVQRVAVQFSANLAGRDGTVYTVEHWVFTRARDVQTRPAPRTHTWPCPSCGAPWSQADADPRRCGHCGQEMQAGRFDWAVEQIWVDSEDAVGVTLTGTVVEVGNDLPTVVDNAAHELAAAITRDDPAVTWTAVSARVQLIYDRLNAAWNARDLQPVRGLVTHSLRDYLQYWLDTYARQGLANAHDDARLERLDLARVTRERDFDAITLRVFADGLDYTVNGTGTIVAGSNTMRRAYTEYWTFLRSSARRGPVVATPTCPNCGAPLDISDRGACNHCNAELENGAFDWVLSKIEQDDVYRG